MGNKISDRETATEKIEAKELEQRSELYKESPDFSKAGALQKEISELESELDQKRIDHMLKIRKLSPNQRRQGIYDGRLPHGLW